MIRKKSSKRTQSARLATASKQASEMPPNTNRSSLDDDLNRAIVKILQKDGRIPFKTIAEMLGISEGTVRNRVAWMKEARMLEIVAIADPAAITYRADAMLGIKVSAGASPALVAERLKPHPEVVYIVWVSGRYDLLVEIVTDSKGDFERFTLEHCYGQADIASIEIMTGLVMYKNQFLLKNHVSD
jgi:Lrp/AsnC family transcriptional regulator for asnA, asnC and gidA